MGDENVLELVVVMAAQPYECTKNHCIRTMNFVVCVAQLKKSKETEINRHIRY